MQAAMATGDLNTLLTLMARTSKMTVTDYINSTTGSLRFLYYMFLRKFKKTPVDLEELVDGVLFLDVEGYIQKTAMEEAKAQASAEAEKRKGKR